MSVEIVCQDIQYIKKKSFPFRNDNEYGYLVYHLLIEYIESITLCHEIQNIIKCDNYKDEK